MSIRPVVATEILAIVLAALCFAGALGVVYSKHLSRQRYIELSEVQSIIDDLDIEWSRLQIEESTFSRHGLVEKIATQRLDMVFPEGNSVIVVTQP